MSMNKKIVQMLSDMSSYTAKDGNHFKSRAYDREKDKIMLFDKEIKSKDDLKSIKLGKSAKKTILEFIDTGNVAYLEKAKVNPKYHFADVYGIGPKKAEELVSKNNVKSISELRARQNELLNDVQKKGLKYYEDVLKRIPRREIISYEKKMNKIFDGLNSDNKASMTIVGSYRRGAKDSGDIDVIITSIKKDTTIFKDFLDAMGENILKEYLSRGNKKSLTIGKINKKPARRLDFMFTSLEEWPFAILYFTGSKLFNTLMRARANNMNLTMNEHGLYHFKNKKKGDKINVKFKTEKDIFDYLGIQYVEPEKRNEFKNFKLLN